MPKSTVDKMVDSKYGPNSAVTTKSGKLTISGLLQVWYYSIQNDNQGLFNSANNGVADTNEASDNDSFRIRRAEIKFTMDIHENVTAVVNIDPAREATSFPAFPTNQGFKRINNISPEFQAANDPGGSNSVVSGVQFGSGGVPRLLKDAYINYHGVVPHHDFTIGQFKPQFGEEGPRSSAQLDFCERSFIGQFGDERDMGIQAHGVWWDDRFQYWAGAFNGAGNYFGSAGSSSNRADDNDAKDMLVSALVRPVWKNECWGSLELGWSSQMGWKGESSGGDPINAPVNGLNRNAGWAIRHDAWASYMPGGPVRGLWLRGEWQYVKDRNAPNTVIDLQDPTTPQSAGRPTHTQGWYAAAGYKMSDCCFSDCSPGFLKSWEFTFRYESFQNVMVGDLVNPQQHTDVFRTNVTTVGANYYIKGHNAKIQANYNWVRNPDSGNSVRDFHDVKNDNFVVNFQVAF